jgi:hypothetical protein
MCQSRIAPVSASTDRTAAAVAQALLTMISSRRLSYVSASFPPIMVNSATGANCNAVTVPRAVPESFDSSRTSQSSATNCIQVPVSEMA